MNVSVNKAFRIVPDSLHAYVELGVRSDRVKQTQRTETVQQYNKTLATRQTFYLQVVSTFTQRFKST